MGRHDELVKRARFGYLNTPIGNEIANKDALEFAAAIESLEAENARLQSGRDHYQDALVRADDTIKALEAENERMRDCLDKLARGDFSGSVGAKLAAM